MQDVHNLCTTHTVQNIKVGFLQTHGLDMPFKN